MDNFFGDINGHNIYDSDVDFAEGDDSNIGYSLPHGDSVACVSVITKKETAKAILFAFLVVESGSKTPFAEKWIPKSQIHSLVDYLPKYGYKQELSLGAKCLRIKFWLFEKILHEFRQKNDWKKSYKLSADPTSCVEKYIEYPTCRKTA